MPLAKELAYSNGNWAMSARVRWYNCAQNAVALGFQDFP